MFKSKYELVADVEAQCVYVGDRSFDHPDFNRRDERDFSFKRDMVAAEDSHHACLISAESKDIMRHYCELLGPKFCRRFYAANYYTFIEPHFSREVANMFTEKGTQWRNYSPRIISRAIPMAGAIERAEKDGLMQLIPAIVSFQKTPQEIRQQVGKAAWKKIHALSKTKAKKIMQILSTYHFKEVSDVYCDLCEMPSGVIPYINLGRDVRNEGMWAAKNCKRKNSESFYRAFLICRDTKNMIGDRFNLNWSMKRMQREHDAAIDLINREAFSDEPFSDDWKFEGNGFIARRLTSPAKISSEGQKMHHCVGSYANQAQEHMYAVFEITGKERATLGLGKFTGMRRNEYDGMWHFDQLYGPCNSSVSVECREFAQRVLKEFNEK